MTETGRLLPRAPRRKRDSVCSRSVHLSAVRVTNLEAPPICAIVHNISQGWGSKPPAWPIYKGLGTRCFQRPPGGRVGPPHNGQARPRKDPPPQSLSCHRPQAPRSGSGARVAAHLAEGPGRSRRWAIPHLAAPPGKVQKGPAKQQLNPAAPCPFYPASTCDLHSVDGCRASESSRGNKMCSSLSETAAHAEARGM
jgi:hypothetical protein